MLTTLPLEAFVCREVMTNYWFPDEHWNPNRHLIFTTSLVITAMTISLLICDLGAVFELIGATSACALAYILPPLCYIKLSTRSWKTIPAVLCVILGFVVMGISLVLAVAKMIKSTFSLRCLYYFVELTLIFIRRRREPGVPLNFYICKVFLRQIFSDPDKVTPERSLSSCAELTVPSRSSARNEYVWALNPAMDLCTSRILVHPQC